MVANFINFDDKPVELQVRGKLMSSGGKVMLDGHPVASFEGGILEPITDQPNQFENITKMTIAPLGTSPP